VFTPGEEKFCGTVIFELGSPKQQINQLTVEASKQASKQASRHSTESLLKTYQLLSQEIPHILQNLTIITLFTTACHWYYAGPHKSCYLPTLFL
jgi:hypothetical protein